MDDDIVDDDLAALDAPSRPTAARPHAATAAASSGASGQRPKVQQPKPQSLGAKASASAILVSPRQKGNPVLDNVRSVGWEYSDIPADFVLGATTCALFLSLKYHRLHPEYIYTRITNLAGRYGLRIVLVMVDIENHEEPLKELSKTSLINNVTILLAWSAQEAGRYLELYKNLEHAAPTSIKGIQAQSYPDQLVEFITVPRGINKTDAVSLVSNFGSVRTAINARPEEIGLIGGWGDKKVQRWCDAVRKPFRVERAAKRDGLRRTDTLPDDLETPGLSREQSRALIVPEMPDPQVAARLGIGAPVPFSAAIESSAPAAAVDDFGDDEEAFAEMEAAMQAPVTASAATPAASARGPTIVPPKRKPSQDDLTSGVAAALTKLRKK